MTYNTAVIGLGASGGLVSILLSKNPKVKVTGFDIKEPFSTLLPTGGGRCNITYDEDDIKEFVKNYPRGDKFLLSVFSKFNQQKTRKLFDDLGIKTYVQEDRRVFPLSNSSKQTVQTLIQHLKTDNFKQIKECVTSIIKTNNGYILTAKNKQYFFDKVIIATGGNQKSLKIVQNLGHSIIEPKPSLCSFDIEEKYLYKLSGLSFKNVELKAEISNHKYVSSGDILIGHKFITGPCIFKLSALTAFENVTKETPLKINLKLTNIEKEQIEEDLKQNAKKNVKNVFSMHIPESFIEEILKKNKIDTQKQTAQLKKSEKELIFKDIYSLRLNVIGRIKDSEIVMAGGLNLDEINSKTMESKLHKGLYFIGEMLNIDGYTGGFNLQNCWSSAYICSLNFFE